MTSKPASRNARAMIFAPRSWPSRPGLATKMRNLRSINGPSPAAFSRGSKSPLPIRERGPEPSVITAGEGVLVMPRVFVNAEFFLHRIHDLAQSAVFPHGIPNEGDQILGRLRRFP